MPMCIYLKLKYVLKMLGFYSEAEMACLNLEWMSMINKCFIIYGKKPFHNTKPELSNVYSIDNALLKMMVEAASNEN